jgi:hypothetical protein
MHHSVIVTNLSDISCVKYYQGLILQFCEYAVAFPGDFNSVCFKDMIYCFHQLIEDVC